MIWWEWILTLVCLFFAALPALLFYRNLSLYLPPPEPEEADPIPAVSVLIPARNEENSIRAAVESALASERVTLEVVVLDDQSTDSTAQIVQELAANDSRVRLLSADPLPAGWCGKQRACAVLAEHAQYHYLVFIDADVRLQPKGLSRLVKFQQTSGAPLVSGVPHQITETWMEKLVIPLIHFLLLGFLPIQQMRQSTQPGFGAGCGQLFLAEREGYQQMGGHATIRTSLHDGITLPRAFRNAGLMTDLCDATDVATCRMYHSASQVWSGLSKNAGEGLAKPALIGPITLLLFAGQVLPLLLLLSGWLWQASLWFYILSAVATVLAYLPRILAAIRFRQSWLGVIFHPLSVLILLAIQWHSFIGSLLGRPSTWKGRSYAKPGESLS